MKFYTPYLIKFSCSILLITILFKFTLKFFIEHNNNALIVLTAIIYGITMFFLGRYFGKKDEDYLPILDIGFRSHFATFLIYNAVNVSWFLFGFSGSYEIIKTAYYTAAIWGILLLIHLIIYLLIQKKSINSLNAKDLFE